jgi:predicted transcriptional regulator
MATPRPKERAFEAIRDLPGHATVEEVLERLYLVAKVERGLRQADAGRTVSHEEAKRRMDGRRPLMWRLSALLLAAMVLAGCDELPTEPGFARVDGLPEELVFSLELLPDEVEPHGDFVVIFEVKNRSWRSVKVGTPHSCLVLPSVYRNGERVPFRGTAHVCLAVVTTHTFPPGETKTLTWNLQAELHAQHPGDPEGTPAPPGTYRVRAEFEFSPRNGQRPGVGAPLRVR